MMAADNDDDEEDVVDRVMMIMMMMMMMMIIIIIISKVGWVWSSRIGLLLLTVTDVSTTCAVVIFRVFDSDSVTVNNNSRIHDYVHLDGQTQPTFEMTPGFKPFTFLLLLLWKAVHKNNHMN